MYQANTGFKGPDEKEFEELTSRFEKKIGISLESYSKEEWDLTKKYKPNHACLWNNPENIGVTCVILQKNEKMAFVAFEAAQKNMVHQIYRLEDLSVA